jgi:riboflavin kinase/FMN adenylyltransferase
MLIFQELEKIPQLATPIALTIGNFDGMHRGHLKLLRELKKRAKSGKTAALTFTNHPADVLKHRPPAPALCTLDHKLKLLEEEKIDLLLLLTFTEELSKETFEQFLQGIKKRLPFTFLLLGKGASFGKENQGDETRVKALQEKLQFHAEYLEKESLNGQVISSGLIRKELEKGDLRKVSELLGRPYSIYTSFAKEGSCTLNLILPPSGDYRVTLLYKGKEVPSRAQINQTTKTLQVDLSPLPTYSPANPIEIQFTGGNASA